MGRSRRWLAFLFIAVALNADEPATPCAFEFQLEGVAAGHDAYAVSATFLSRHAFSAHGWFWAVGLQEENFYFAPQPARPARLQDHAAVFKVEYFEDGPEPVAEFSMRPGWYFGGHATRSSWDIPVELTTGVPIARDFDGVVGFGNARFYHHPLPILGFIWKVNRLLQLECVYPEPAAIFILGEKSSLRLGGELAGGGFLFNSPAGPKVVEYESYRVGATWRVQPLAGLELALGAGVETERSFDFFHERQQSSSNGHGYFKLSATFSR